MQVLKNGRWLMTFAVMLFLGVGLMGCATSSQVKVLEERIQQALDNAEEALKECQSAKAAVEDSSRYSAEASASAQRAESAALKSEKAAVRAEEAATLATGYARSTEKMVKKCEDIFERITAK